VPFTSTADQSVLAEEQAALRRVATLVARAAPPPELFSAVAEEVGRLLSADITTLGRYDADDMITWVAAWSATGAETVPVGHRSSVSIEGVTSLVCETARPARIDCYSADRPGARQFGIRAAVAAPITVEGGLWGTMNVWSTNDEPFPADAEERLGRFTDLISTAIANREARDQVSRLLEEQAALRRVATLVARGVRPVEIFSAVSNEVGRLFGCEQAAVGRFEPDGSAVVVVGVSEAIRGVSIGTRWPLEDFLASTAVYRTGRPARTDHAGAKHASGVVAESLHEMNLVSTIAAPIVVQGSLWGVMTVSDAHARLPPDAEERVERFTELVGTAIANAESRDALAASEARAHELAREQAALGRVATLVAEGASADELFSAVAQEVAAVIGSPIVVLHRYEADATFTMMGVAGDTAFTVGSRWPVEDEGLAGMILATCRPARKDDYATLPGPIGVAAREHRIVSTVGAPIVVDGSIWGSMVAAGRPGEPIPAGTEERLSRFTELVATAIANSEAHGHLAQLAAEQAALRRVATLVAEGRTAEELFAAVAGEVAQVLGVPAVTLDRFETDDTTVILGSMNHPAFPAGSRWPLEEGTVSRLVKDTGRAARVDDYAVLDGAVARAALSGSLSSAVGVPVTVDGRVWGVVCVSRTDGGRLPDDTESRLDAFKELFETAISNAESRAALDASRARIVATADATRRQIERNLHDGIQQLLVTLALRARSAAEPSTPGVSPREELSRIAADLGTVLDELREISRGIHPAILSDAGLDDALKALARRSTIPVELDVHFEGRYELSLEATIYYVAAESITNAAKHAHASVVSVRGGKRDDAIELEIRDDGVGGAEPSRGSGIIGIKDRVDTLGGTISVSSPAGAGTTVHVRLPASPSDESDLPGASGFD
jgi:signal transduction histidine kinase